MSFSRLAATAAVLTAALLALLPAPAHAATAIDLGTARSFAVLAGSGITNTGATTITGDVGSFGSSTAMTGFNSVTLLGVNHGGDAVTQDAKNALTTAYNQAAASTPATAVAVELGGLTLTPGIYHSGTLGLTNVLTLDTQGDPNAVFIFQADSTLITAAASSVVVLGGSTACNVFWKVGSSATFGADTTFVGNVLAAQSISAGNGATFQGRLLASVGAVTLHRNTITATTCAASVPTTPSTPVASTDATPTADVPVAAVAPSEPAGTVAAPASATPTPTATPTATAAPTPPGRTTATTPTPRPRPSGGTATGVGRPELATTGPVEDLLPLVGATAIALGLLFVRASRPLPALRHAVPRKGRIPAAP